MLEGVTIMTWAFIISFLLAVFKIAVTCIPSDGVDWIINKFSLHQKLDSKDVTVTFKGTYLEETEKARFTADFNEAMFLEKYFIFPGNEELFLNPETDVIPFVINVVKGNKNVKIFVFSYEDRVDVVKQIKKKVVSYSLRSENLQNISLSPKVSNAGIILRN